MNPRLDRLQTYPFQKLSALLEGAQPRPGLRPIPLYIGEPKHDTPAFIKQALCDSLAGLAGYPATIGTIELRQAIAAWLTRRYGLAQIDPETQIVPVAGTREALFAIAQAVVDTEKNVYPVVVSPNPFYQIYEGAAILANAEPVFLNNTPDLNYACDWNSLPKSVWERVQLIYVCSPGNPTGHVMDLDEWRAIFELSDKYGFVIASDECYSEIYLEAPPLGALQAAHQLGRAGYGRLVAFSSLSKRSNCPGMRSGFAAGDASLIRKFLLYRTYHGSAMSLAVQQASIAAWSDEKHVEENRRLYAEKFRAVLPLLAPPLEAGLPQGGFYLWLRTPIDDAEFVRRLHAEYNVLALPGSYLARDAEGRNPGKNHVRIALVTPLDECVEAMRRIAQLAANL